MAGSAALAGASTVEFEDPEANTRKRNRAASGRKRKQSTPDETIELPEIRQPGSLCSTDLERQETLLYAQRTVWVNLQEIIESAIRQSLKQNYTAAKFLCEFAGVFAASEEEPPAAAETTLVPSGPEAMRMFLTRVDEGE
jgi:hypothetical protein